MKTKLKDRGKLQPARKVCHIGIDNGVSGSVGMLCNGESLFFKIPVTFGQDYVKASRNATRINTVALLEQLEPVVKMSNKTYIMIERPMINPRRFAATVSASRAMEAVLIVADLLAAKYHAVFQWVDSKEWQSVALPRGTKGDATKLRSMQIGCRLYPEHSELISKQKDADGLLIAEHCRRQHP